MLERFRVFIYEPADSHQREINSFQKCPESASDSARQLGFFGSSYLSQKQIRDKNQKDFIYD